VIAIGFFAVSMFAAAPRPNSVVIPLVCGSQCLIPVAGSTPGANGTFFRSDISIVNLADHDETVALTWLPQDGNSSITRITIAKHAGIRSGDFVADYLSQTGIGAIFVTAESSEGIDMDADLFVSCRIWTPQPGTSGTTSQTLPGVIPGSPRSASAARLVAVGGADNPANYRTNVGIVNFGAGTQTFTITVTGTSNVFVVNLPPNSMRQISVGNGLLPTQQILIQNTTAAMQSNSWIVYGSTVDNITGDAWSELAIPGQ
jgi:hypothetical protein